MDTTQTKVLEALRVLQNKYTPDELQLLGSLLLMVEPDETEVEGHMMQSMTVYDAARLHQKDLLREAQELRLAEEATKGQPSLGARIGHGIGDFLVAAGRRLQGRPAVARARAAGD